MTFLENGRMPIPHSSILIEILGEEISESLSPTDNLINHAANFFLYTSNLCIGNDFSLCRLTNNLLFMTKKCLFKIRIYLTIAFLFFMSLVKRFHLPSFDYFIELSNYEEPQEN